MLLSFFFFFNDTATTEIYTLSLHDALPISCAPEPRRARSRRLSGHRRRLGRPGGGQSGPGPGRLRRRGERAEVRSEEHTSELQSQSNLVCRLLLEKKKEIYHSHVHVTNPLS